MFAYDRDEIQDMKKLLNYTDWLLLGAGGFIDFVQELRDPFHLIENYYRNFYGYVPSRFQKTNYYKTYWNNLKTGNLSKVVKNGQVFLQLTSVGKEKIRRKFPYVNFQKKIWDDMWRIAIFDIEEESRWVRDKFRSTLKELGFGQLQKSVWISPYDFLGELKDFLNSHKLTDKVILIETENFFVEDIKTLARKLWPLDEVNHYYKEIEEEIQLLVKMKNKTKRKKPLPGLREKIVATFLSDPHLPEEMLPDDWYGEKVKREIKNHSIFDTDISSVCSRS